MTRRALTGAICALVAALGAPQTATAAPAVVYVCGKDLCRIDPDGSSRKRLARAQPFKPVYATINVRDSRRLGWRQGDRAYLADRDGRRRRSFQGSPVFATDLSFLAFYVQTANITFVLPSLDVKATPRQVVGGAAFAYLVKGGRFFGQVGGVPFADYQQVICELDVAASFTCRRHVATALPGGSLREFDLSRDGRFLVAAEYTAQEGGRARLALWDARTGTRIRTLTKGHDDHDPSFSPDGRTIVFSRDVVSTDDGDLGKIARVPARGGRVRTIATNAASPSWVR